MKSFFVFSLFHLLLFQILFSQPFFPYELIKYKVKFSFITAGWAEIELKRFDDEKDIYHIRLDTQSSGLVSSIFNVEDHAESWIDKNICSLKYIKNQREGKWVADEEVSFDYKSRKIFFEIKKKKERGEIETKREEIEMGENECFQDMISTLYYFRTLKIEEGKIYQIPTFDRGRIFKTELHILGRERISTELGEFNAYLLQPISKFEGAFRTRKGKMWVWISADENKIPLKIKAKFTFGFVYMEITYYQRGETILTPQKTGFP
jgi:hypothetical protein